MAEVRTIGIRRSSLVGDVFGDFVFDAVMTSTSTLEVEPTTHPVEEGADVTDHAQIKPRRLTMKVVQSNTPIGGTQEARRDINALEALEAILLNREPVTVIDGLRVFENMLLKSISSERSAQVGQAIEPDLDFLEIRIANQVLVPIPEGILAGRASGGSSEASKGVELSLAIGASATAAGQGAAAAAAAAE